jgi:hypothetical protein
MHEYKLIASFKSGVEIEFISNLTPKELYESYDNNMFIVLDDRFMQLSEIAFVSISDF